MGLSINPVSLLVHFLARKKEDRERVADFLDSIADDAAELASVWEKVVNDIISGSRISNETNKVSHNLLKGKIFPFDMKSFLNELLMEKLNPSPLVNPSQLPLQPNIAALSRLLEFYSKVSTVMGKSFKHDMESVLFHIGRLLQSRNITKKLIEDKLSSIQNPFFFDNTNSDEDLLELIKSVKVLHKEAAAVAVLAKTFRAST